MNKHIVTTAIAGLMIATGPVFASGEGPFEIKGQTVFEQFRDGKTETMKDTAKTVNSTSHAYDGQFISDQPFEINGKTVFEAAREKRENQAIQGSATSQADADKKPGLLQRIFGGRS